MAIMTTDVVMLGHLSTTALAAAALGNTAFFFCWILGCGPVAAVAPMIAHTLGAEPGNVTDIRSAVRMGFWAMLAISLPLITLLLFIEPIYLFLGQTPVLAAGAQAFTRALCWGLPFSLGYQVLRNFSTALSRPRASLIVMVTAVFFNAAGDYAFIFGHFGAPKLGVTGSGLASACSYAFSFLMMVVVVRLTPSLHKYRIFAGFFDAHWEKLKEVFRLGMPIGFTMMFEAMLFAGSTLLMGRFSTASVAAHMIALNVPFGIGMASTVRVGLAAGAGDKEAVRRAGYSAILMSVAFMSVTAVLLWLFPEMIANAYLDRSASTAEVIALAIVFLHVAAVFQIADGVQVVGAMSLRGLKDANTPMWIAGGSYWIAGFPTCVALGFGLHMGGLGIWIGLAFALLVAAILMVWRFWYLSRDN
jgi:MATE family multidrug resistance protein